MKTNQMRKLSSALVISGSVLIAGCNGGTGGQTLTGAPITANAAKSLFTTNECLTAKINFTGSSTWYLSGTIDITNTCSTEIDLSKQTISFTSQDKNGNKVSVGTLNNWWINNSSYKLNFTNGNANQQIGTVTAENGNATIKAKQTISFNGGLNLNGSAFNNEIAQSSLAINGASPEPVPPTPTPDPPEPVPPTPTPSDDYPVYPAQRGSYTGGTIVHGTDGALYQCLSTSVASWCNSVNGEWAYAPGTGTYWSQAWKVVSAPTPISTGSLNVVVDTSNANCSGSACGVVTANVTNSSGTVVSSFTVPNTALGGKYTQSITDLKTGNYSVTTTTINQTTVSYTPATADVKSNTTSTITVKYDKTQPATKTGTASINLGNYVPNYTGDLQVEILNSKDNDKVVGNYVVKQGGIITTAELPVSDSTHVYRVKLTTGIADPLQGLYYIESGQATLTINKDVNTSFNIPMTKSSVALKNVTLAISGLENNDITNIVFSDAANKYNYVNYTNQTNGNVVYKLENSLNTGISVTA
ncbi:MAG: hypothetical protein PHC75_09860, partial [Burkholderiales bacterium]|nr:hypothetical protein [Burkholderiales bacterium]